jgi:uncharacterized protein YndB with AHSA1/START domain
MTEFLGNDGGQVAHEVTGLTAAAEEVVIARPELVWDLVADVTRVGGWSPECIRAVWLGELARPEPGARFTGRNRFPNGFEYEVTCVVTEADRPRAFAWVVLDDSGDPARPSSSWRYRIDPLPAGGSRVLQRFTHGPGASYLRATAAKAPDQAARIIAARRDGLQANMSATLRAMKAAAESTHGSGPPLSTSEGALQRADGGVRLRRVEQRRAESHAAISAVTWAGCGGARNGGACWYRSRSWRRPCRRRA